MAGAHLASIPSDAAARFQCASEGVFQPPVRGVPGRSVGRVQVGRRGRMPRSLAARDGSAATGRVALSRCARGCWPIIFELDEPPGFRDKGPVNSLPGKKPSGEGKFPARISGARGGQRSNLPAGCAGEMDPGRRAGNWRAERQSDGEHRPRKFGGALGP